MPYSNANPWAVPVSPNSFSWARALRGASHAYLQVQLVGPAGQLGTVRGALLDTGASLSVFGTLMAQQAGYSLANLRTTMVTLANGTAAQMLVIPNATLLVEGHTVGLSQLLLRAGSGTDLLCPDDLLNATQFAFDLQHVYFD